jgi:hypothetical protein
LSRCARKYKSFLDSIGKDEVFGNKLSLNCLYRVHIVKYCCFVVSESDNWRESVLMRYLDRLVIDVWGKFFVLPSPVDEIIDQQLYSICLLCVSNEIEYCMTSIVEQIVLHKFHHDRTFTYL